MAVIAVNISAREEFLAAAIRYADRMQCRQPNIRGTISNLQFIRLGGSLVGIYHGFDERRLRRTQRGGDRGPDFIGTLAPKSIGAAGFRERNEIDRRKVAAKLRIADLFLF